MAIGKVITALGRYGVLILLAILFVLFSILQKGFLSAVSIFDILRQTGVGVILALGVTAVLAVGEFDISFGTIVSFSSVLLILLLKWGVNLYLTWIICLIVAVALALFNTVLIVNLRIHSFFATLGSAALILGLAKWITNGSTILLGSYPHNFDLLGQGKLWNLVPIQLIIAVVFSAIVILILNHSKLGRFFYATGANPLAAMHAGIPIARVKRLAFVIIGAGAGIVGVVVTSQVAITSPYLGDGYTYPSLIAALLGASFLKRGIPNAWGAMVACLLLSVLTVGLVWNNVELYLKDIFFGALLLISVGIVAVLRMRQAQV